MPAIVTTYRGPTETQGSRICASCEGRRLTVSYDHSLSESQNHWAAARALAEREHGEKSRLVSSPLRPGVEVHVVLLDTSSRRA
jgi:hypothetical protein